MLMPALFSTSAATLVRLKYVIEIGHPSGDEEWLLLVNLRALMWSNIELAMAILAGSLSALRPLVRFVTGMNSTYGRSGDKESGQYIQHSSGHEMGPLGPKMGESAAEAKAGGSDGDSQECILADRHGIKQQVDVKITYST